jgi:hypothetical protein
MVTNFALIWGGRYMPIIPIPPDQPTTYTIPIGFSSGSASITPQDSVSLFSFLKLVSTAKDDHKQSTFNSQEVDALVNREYFLNVFQEINFLMQKYIKTNSYADSLSLLNSSYNARVNNINPKIDTYNNAKNELNDKISNMNNAINAINSNPSPSSSDIAAYNNAVLVYNNYLTLTGNPAMLAYANAATTVYNNPTNTDNTVTIPAINELVDELGLGIPNVPLLSPSSISTGAGTRPPASTYTGAFIPLISPSSYPDIGRVDNISGPQSKNDIIETYFMPFAQNYLAALAAASKRIAKVDDYRSFVNFILKQGFQLNPAEVNAFILNGPKPQLPQGTSAADGSLGTLIVGVESSNLERILSTALFTALVGKESLSIPPNVYDQINVFAIALLARIGSSAGITVVKLLGETLKSLKADNPAIDVALAAAILQNILKVVSDSKATADALFSILKEIPGISDVEAKALTDKLVAAQNTSLLLFGGLSTAQSLKAPSLVQNLVNTSLSNSQDISSTPRLAPRSSTPTENSAPSVLEDSVYLASDNPFSPQSVKDLLNDNRSLSSVQEQLRNRLSEDSKFLNPSAASVANQALTSAVANLKPNATPAQFQTSLNEQLINLGVQPQDAAIVSASSADFVKSQIPPPVQAALTPVQLADTVRTQIAAVLKEDVTRSLPNPISEEFVKKLTDVTDPNSFVSLLSTQLKNYQKLNDSQVAAEIVQLRREFERPHIDTFVILEKLKDPANSLILSFMTGLMYDRSIPTNWQKPLSIQV